MGIFGVKTHWIIGQKSKINARYYKCFLRNSITPPPPHQKKSRYVLQISPVILGNFLTFLPDNLKTTLDYRCLEALCHYGGLTVFILVILFLLVFDRRQLINFQTSSVHTLYNLKIFD